jgi:hypothetical protein
VLGVDGDALAAGKIAKVDAVAAAIETELDAAVLEALAAQAFADAKLVHELDGVVFKKAGADTLLNVLAGVEFEDDGFDAEALKEEREEEARGSGADDGDLSAHWFGLGNDSAPADWLLLAEAEKQRLAPRRPDRVGVNAGAEKKTGLWIRVGEVVEAEVLSLLELELDAGGGVAPAGADTAEFAGLDGEL